MTFQCLICVIQVTSVTTASELFVATRASSLEYIQNEERTNARAMIITLPATYQLYSSA